MNKTKLVKAMKEIASVGVGRMQKNESQGYMYRGVDDVLNVVTPILANNGIYINPCFNIESVKEVPTRSGNAERFMVKLSLKFCDMESETDNVLMETISYGCGQDNGDKAIMKAQTSALKYGLIYAFGIPVLAQSDGDAVSPEMDGVYNKRVGGGNKEVKPKIAEVTPAKQEVKQEVKQEEKPTIKVNSFEEMMEVAQKEEPKQTKEEPKQETTEGSNVKDLSDDMKQQLASMGIMI